MNLNDFVYERIEENRALFSNEEWDVIESNSELIKKVYIIGVMNNKSVENENKTG